MQRCLLALIEDELVGQGMRRPFTSLDHSRLRALVDRLRQLLPNIVIIDAVERRRVFVSVKLKEGALNVINDSGRKLSRICGRRGFGSLRGGTSISQQRRPRQYRRERRLCSHGRGIIPAWR